jgi:hypothetical protein
MALADNKALHLPLFRCATKRQVSFIVIPIKREMKRFHQDWP